MKRRKLCSVLLALALLAAALSPSALAADGSRSFTFTLTSGGSSSVDAAIGDEIPVSFVLRRTDSAEDWAMYAWQTEIVYDASVFELVEGSVSAPSGVGSSLRLSGGVGTVCFSDYSLSKTGDNSPAELGECSFTLRVLGGSGSSAVRSTNYLVGTQGGRDVYSAQAEDLTVRLPQPDTPAPAPAPDTPDAPEHFSDVAPDAWYAGAVAFAVDRGLFAGVGDDRFDPDGVLSRAMLVTVLYRLEGEPASAADAGFSDVAEGQWYARAVAWAARNGIVQGYGDAFGPNDPVTREQMAAILLRYAGFKGYDTARRAALDAYADAAQVSTWARDALSWCVAEGFITGTAADALTPGGSATRAQTALILMRFIQTNEAQEE